MSSVTATTDEVEVLLPTETTLRIADIPCRVRRLKTREFLMGMRIFARSMGQALPGFQLDMTSNEALAAQIMALLIVSVPEAIEESIAFVTAIVEPIDGSKSREVAKALVNPDPGDLLDVIEIAATQEKDEIRELAGKAQAMWGRMSKLYQKGGPSGP